MHINKNMMNMFSCIYIYTNHWTYISFKNIHSFIFKQLIFTHSVMNIKTSNINSRMDWAHQSHIFESILYIYTRSNKDLDFSALCSLFSVHFFIWTSVLFLFKIIINNYNYKLYLFYKFIKLYFFLNFKLYLIKSNIFILN